MMTFSETLTEIAYGNVVPFILPLILAFTVYKFSSIYFKRKLPPGPIGLPFVGYSPFLGDEPHKEFKRLAKKYGDIISLRIGTDLVVVLSEYKVLKEVLTHPSALHRHPLFFGHVPERGFFAANGQEWQEQRRFSMQSTKDLGLGRSHWEKLTEEEASTFVEMLRSQKGQPVLIADEFASSSARNVLSFLIGRRLDKTTENDKINLALNFLNQTLENFGLSNPISVMPIIRKFSEFFRIGHFHVVSETIKEFIDFLKEEVAEHRNHKEKQGSLDFIDLYIRKLEEKEKYKLNNTFSDMNLRGNITILFTGGSDAIATSLEWLVRLMAAYPDIQQKVHEELDDALGRDGKITYNERFKLPYTMAVIMEGLRWASIVPLNPSRRANDDIEVNGYIIPKGAEIIGNAWAVHHDPNYWQEPEKFFPERFLNQERTQVVKNPQSFVPFSIGRRNCVGEKIAYIEILIFFTSIMQKFQISLPSGEEVELHSCKGLILHPKPQKLCFVERLD